MILIELPSLLILWAKSLGESFKEMFSRAVKRFVC